LHAFGNNAFTFWHWLSPFALAAYIVSVPVLSNAKTLLSDRRTDIVKAHLHPVEMCAKREHTDADNETTVQERSAEVDALAGIDTPQQVLVEAVEHIEFKPRLDETKRDHRKLRFGNNFDIGNPAQLCRCPTREFEFLLQVMAKRSGSVHLQG